MGAPSTAFYSLAGGATPYSKSEAQVFARRLLNSQAYRESLERRIKRDDLPAAVEVMLWHYAYGKPVESLQVQVVPGYEDLSALPIDELYKRAADLTRQLEEAVALAEAIPADVLQGPWGTSPSP